MAKVVIMPRQGQSVESCIFTEWHKKVGEEVKKGDILFSYETDKASFEEEASEEGVLLTVFCEEGDEVPVLQNVAVIGKSGESFDAFLPSGETADADEVAEVIEEEKPVEATPEVVTKSAAEVAEGKLKISPRAKNLATNKTVPAETLVGSGPEGRVIERDVKAYIATKPKVTPLAREVAKEEGLPVAEAAGTGLSGAVKAKDLVAKNPVYSSEYEIKKLPNIRKMIAKAMHASLQNSAQLTHHLGADARRILELRQKVKATEGAPNITINDMVCFAVIKALKKFPQANAHFMGDAIKYFKKIHLGLAVDTERGLMVPAIKNADDLSITGLSNQFKELAGACRGGNISPELLASDAASFTVSNLGNYGVEMFTPVINLPQVAILGVNTIVPRPKDLGNGAYGFVPYIGLSLTYDHQALDGGEATRFLKQIAIEVENLEIDF